MLSKLPAWVWLGVGVLAFIGGFVNVIGFLGFGRQAITHLTGTTSMVAVSLSTWDIASGARFAAVICSFVFGAVVSGFLIKDSTLRLGRRYGVVMLLESLLLCISPSFLNRNNFWGIYTASCACGLQNAMISAYSGAVIRTTHLSGMFTDLGIFLGHVLRGVKIDVRRLKLCFLVIAGFLLGGIAGGICFRQFGSSALYLPSAITLIASLAYFIYESRRIPGRPG